MDLHTMRGRELQSTLLLLLIWSSFLFTMEGIKVKDERNWYRCITREEMVLLIAAGFDYTNFRADKYNNGNNTYFFERTEKLNKFLEMRQQL